MKNLLPLVLLAGLIFTACKSDGSPGEGESQDDNLESRAGAFDDVATAVEGGASTAEVRKLLLENYRKVSDPTTGHIDPRAGQQYIKLAESLAEESPEDTLAALPLYKAAEVYQALNDYPGAAQVFERIYREYPTFSKAGEALFMLGFTYDENLKDYEKARVTYEKFLSEYPSNTFADDTQLLLQNLGKTDAEMLEMLQNQQQN